MIEDLFEGPHLVILLLVVVLLFGAKRLPDVARGVGQSLRVFKTEVNATTGDATPGDDRALDPPHAVASASGGPTPDDGSAPPRERETRER